MFRIFSLVVCMCVCVWVCGCGSVLVVLLLFLHIWMRKKMAILVYFTVFLLDNRLSVWFELGEVLTVCMSSLIFSAPALFVWHSSPRPRRFLRGCWGWSIPEHVHTLHLPLLSEGEGRENRGPVSSLRILCLSLSRTVSLPGGNPTSHIKFCFQK